MTDYFDRLENELRGAVVRQEAGTAGRSSVGPMRRRTIASGEDPEFGRWQAFISDSSSGPCLGIHLVDPPGVQPGGTSEGCGITETPARIGGGDGPPRTALFGFAPNAAKRVRIEADGRPGREFPTHRTTDSRGGFFFASLPENPDRLPGLRVVALDGDGRPVATIEGP